MLNTLYPPAISSQPTSKLTPTILKRQRDGFFKYIQGVEKSGTRVLVNLMQQGKKPTDKNGWAAVRGTLETYLQVANSIIAECAEIVDIDDVTITANTTKRNGRKVDSGMSFSSTESRPSTSSSSSNVGNSEKPARELRSKRSMNIARTGSTLEKIARELRNIGRSKTEVNEMVPPTAEVKAADNKSISEATGEKTRGLRKIRSLGALSNLRSGNSSSSSLQSKVNRQGSETPAFNVDEMRRQRLIWEANQQKIAMSHMAMAPMG